MELAALLQGGTTEDLNMELQPHQQRVVTEKGELDEKIGKLFGFITSENFEAIVPQDERYRLTLQYNVMMAYSKVLEMRIEAFGC